jgi:hypothetical protein
VYQLVWCSDEARGGADTGAACSLLLARGVGRVLRRGVYLILLSLNVAAGAVWRTNALRRGVVRFIVVFAQLSVQDDQYFSLITHYCKNYFGWGLSNYNYV